MWKNIVFIINSITIVLMLSLLYQHTVPIITEDNTTILTIPKTKPNHFHKTLYLDRTFEEWEITIITEAALEWTRATNNIAEFDVVVLPTNHTIDVPTSIIVVKSSPDTPSVMAFDYYSKSTALGIYHGEMEIKNIELVSLRLAEYSYKMVVLHELGHALGLDHNSELKDIDTLMYPYADLGADHITPTDLVNFCKIYQCDAAVFNQ